MRIILTANFSPWSSYSGGGQRSTHNLATELSKRGHDVTVVYTKPPWEAISFPSPHYNVAWAALPAIRSHRQAPFRFLSTLFVAKKVDALLSAAAFPTVVHSQGEEGAVLPHVCRRHQVPLVATPRYPSYPSRLNGDHTSRADLLALFFTAPKFLLLGHLLRNADLICSTSRSAASMIKQAYGIPSSRFSFIPNGVSPTFLEKPVTHTPDGPLVFFGRLEKTKGVDVLIEALALLDRKEVTRKCVIAGRGRAESAFKQAIAQHGLQDKVEWAGWIAPSDLANLLARASVAVLPSREESFGNAMAEAMAAGVPVVSTEVGSIPEVVVNGKNGYLVPSGDARALAQHIQDLLNHPETAQALGKAGRKRVRSCFTWPSIACEMERIYSQLTSQFEK